MYQPKTEKEIRCPLEYGLALFGGKWKTRLLCTLTVDGPQRYNELLKKAQGVTNAMLASSLKELEADGLVTRTLYAEVPPRVEYALTDRGKELWPILHRLAHWAENEPFDGDESQAE